MTSDRPFVTAIMPIRDEADFIAESLAAVLNQEYPPNRMEVLIVDGMSTDATREIIADLIASHPETHVEILDNPQHVVPSALNIALRHASGDVIVRVDGHCEIAPDYIASCVQRLQEYGVQGVGGVVENIARTPMGAAIAAAQSSPFGVGGSAFRIGKQTMMFVDTVPFAAYTRAATELAGPFDEELVRNQDDEYNYRLRSLGGKLLLSPDIRSRYYSRNSLRKLWRQYFEYGYWKVRVMQKHFRQMRPRQIVPPLFVLALLGGAVLALAHPVALALWMAFVASYIATSFVASVLAARRSNWRCLPMLPIVFATLHISYGLGFLVGLVRFAGRWTRR